LALASVLALFASAAAFAALRFLDWEQFFPALGAAALWLLIGGLLLGAALWLSPWQLPFMQPARETASVRTARRPLIAGLVLLALGTIFGGRLIDALPQLSAHAQFALLLAAVLLIGWALSGAPRHLPEVPRRELAGVAALTVAALVLRAVETTSLVPGLVDEVHFIVGVHAFQDNPALPLLRTTSTYLPATMLYSYWEWLAVTGLGRSLEGLRFVSALAGALTVPAVYLLARALFNRRTALAAALLLLAFPPSLHISRNSFAQPGDAFFGALALALLAHGLCRGQRWAWAWGGVALGMTQYFYEGGRLLFPLLVLAWFVYMIIVWGVRRMRPHRRGMAIALLAAVLVALPMYVTMAVTGAPFSSRFEESGGTSGLSHTLREFTTLPPFDQYTAARQFVDPFLVYMALPDATGDFYGSDQPLVLPILVPLLFLGLAHILWRPRSPAVLVAGLVLAASAGNILLSANDWSNRYVMVMPMLPVLMAVGLCYTLPLLWPRASWPHSPRLRRVGALLLPLLALSIAALQLTYYLGPFQRDYAVSFRAAKPGADFNDALLRAAALPDAGARQVILVSATYQDAHVPRGLFSFLVDSDYPVLTMTRDQLTPDFLLTLPRDRGYVFFLEPADAESLRVLASAFPLGPPDYSTRPLLPANEQYLMFVVGRPNGVADD
jgi:hypothetical protein